MRRIGLCPYHDVSAKTVAGAGVKGIKSLQKGLMKGAKKLQGLVDRILQKFKFKRFS
ncbi:hypothetical protein [Paenibacillus sp. 22594]|uniref:hypothetical protein n=1 Tax=Paenibacillus sp. 22594 TaxID=3453947 RepID=UPI003F855452